MSDDKENSQANNNRNDENSGNPFLTRRALALAIFGSFNRPGNKINRDEKKLISKVTIADDETLVSVTINAKIYRNVRGISLYWKNDLFVVSYQDKQGNNLEDFLSIDFINQLRVTRKTVRPQQPSRPRRR